MGDQSQPARHADAALHAQALRHPRAGAIGADQPAAAHGPAPVGGAQTGAHHPTAGALLAAAPMHILQGGAFHEAGAAGDGMRGQGRVEALAVEPPGMTLAGGVVVAHVDRVVAADHPHPLQRQRVRPPRRSPARPGGPAPRRCAGWRTRRTPSAAGARGIRRAARPDRPAPGAAAAADPAGPAPTTSTSQSRSLIGTPWSRAATTRRCGPHDAVRPPWPGRPARPGCRRDGRRGRRRGGCIGPGVKASTGAAAIRKASRPRRRSLITTASRATRRISREGDDRVPGLEVMEQERGMHHVDRVIGQRQGTRRRRAGTSHHSYSPGYGGRSPAPPAAGRPPAPSPGARAAAGARNRRIRHRCPAPMESARPSRAPLTARTLSPTPPGRRFSIAISRRLMRRSRGSSVASSRCSWSLARARSVFIQDLRGVRRCYSRIADEPSGARRARRRRAM